MALDSEHAHLTREAKIIIWDEAPMAHKHTFEALDRSLRDIMKQVSHELEALPFGGKTVVLGGDFRQVLRVVSNGSRGQIVAASLKRSSLWQHVKVCKLSINMQELQCRQNGDLANAAAQQAFSDFLLRIGDGRKPIHAELGDDMIKLPAKTCAESL